MRAGSREGRLLIGAAGALLVLAASLALPVRLAAQTTGRIEGRVVDNGGAPVAGIVVSATGPSLPGTRAAATDSQGRFRLVGLPPGEYKVNATGEEGWAVREQAGVVVGLDRAVVLALVLLPVFGEELTVAAGAPAIDPTSTTAGANFPEEVFARLPVSRAFASVAFAVPGVVPGGLGDNPSIAGASAAENRYVLDGLDTTDPGLGTIGTSLPYEFIEEVEVKTGGYGAEYGGALGGVLNVITKSGGNEVHGDLFAYYHDNDLQASEPATETVGRRLGFTRYDYGAGVGGPIRRDRLWYYAAANPNRDETDRETIQRIGVEDASDTLLYAGKLTWQPGPRHQVVASAFGDPTESVSYEPRAAGRFGQEIEGDATNAVVTYLGNVGRELLLQLTAGRAAKETREHPLAPVTPYLDRTGTARWAAEQECGDPDLLAGIQEVSFAPGCVGGLLDVRDDTERSQLRLSLDWFLGNHELRLGSEHRQVESHFDARFPAPHAAPLIDETGFVVAPTGVTGGFVLEPDVHILFVADNASPASETRESAIYLQDRWRPGPHMTFQLGLRADRSHATGSATGTTERVQELEFDFADMVAPRLGIAWDPAGHGRAKLYASFGRFYESFPLHLNAAAFGGSSNTLHLFSYPADGGLPTYSNLGTYLFSFELFTATAVVPGTEPQHTDEYALGFEHQLRPQLVVGVRAVYREVRDVVEDLSVDQGTTTFIANPGGTYTHNPVTGEPLAEPVTFPQARREYRAAGLTVDRRLGAGWQLSGSYVWAKNEGNYGGLYDQQQDQLTPNLTSVFDFASTSQGAAGPLPNDHRHQAKLYGSYRWRSGLAAGAFAGYRSGAPISKLGTHPVYGPGERFVEPRGTAGRLPSVQHLDVHLEAPLGRRRGAVELRLVADLFNVTNELEPVRVNENWTFAAGEGLQPGECGGPGTGPGTSCPEGNPAFGSPLVFQTPRTLRLGAKLSW